MASGAIRANAQAIDMNVTSPTVSPAPALFPGTTTITFNITAELLDQPLSSDDLSTSFASVTISLSDLQGSALLVPSGAGADLFTWTYDAVSNSYTGFSKDVTMTADVVYPITLAGLTTTKITTANTVGFLANLNPPGDLLASASNDDAVSTFTRADLNLPVTLVSFDAKKEGRSVMLRWTTSEETNSDYFEVQHSINGKDWARLGAVKSHGESNVLQNYAFTHETPVDGQNLYRLKMVDNDLTVAYSRICNVVLEGAQSGGYVYPNPARDVLYVKDGEKVSNLSIYNMAGGLMRQSKALDGKFNINGLPAGAYLVKVLYNNGLATSEKVVVAP